MMRYYLPDGSTTDDVLVWARTFIDETQHRVAWTTVGKWRVSTIFTGLASRETEGRPLVYETGLMEYDSESGLWELRETMRAPSRQNALMIHVFFVGWLRTEYELPAAEGDVLADALHELTAADIRWELQPA
jgi:hypothetical protein